MEVLRTAVRFCSPSPAKLGLGAEEPRFKFAIRIVFTHSLKVPSRREYLLIPSVSFPLLLLFSLSPYIIPPRFLPRFSHFTTQVVLQHSNYLQEIGLPIRSKYRVKF